MNRRALVGAAGLTWMAALDSAPAGAAPAGAPPAGGADAAPGGAAGFAVLDGAVGDGASHPLASRFRTIEAARVTYPHARSLSDEIDWCVLQGAIDAAVARGSGAVHVANTGRAYVLNRTLTVNPNRVTLRGDGSTLDFRGLRDGECAILLKADGAPAYGHERHVLQGFELVGPGREQHFAGLLFRTDTPGLSSRAQVRDCTIHGFLEGIRFGNRAYGIGFSHVSIFECAFCVNVPYNLEDAGETISFSQCYLFNSGCLVANGGGFDLKFIACSMDYAGRIVWDNNGGIDMVGCRLEIGPPTDPPLHCNGGRINMFGGFFLINGSHDSVHAAEMFALSNPGASVHLFSVTAWNWRTTTGKLTRGPGKIYLYQGTEITDVPSDVGHP